MQRLVASLLLVMVGAGIGYAYITSRIPFLYPRFPNSPAIGVEEVPSPLGTPPAVEGRTDEYAFLEMQDDGVSPVTWDACRPIHYVISPENMPTGVEPLVHEAAAEMADRTGYTIVYDGYSSEPYVADRLPFQPGYYGDRWAPVLVSFGPEANVSVLGGDVVGYGGSTSVGNPGKPSFFVSGRITLDSNTFEELLRYDEENSTRRARIAILHEFGHVMGLDHVDDPDQVMFPTEALFHYGLQPGDLAGLAALNTGACAPWL